MNIRSLLTLVLAAVLAGCAGPSYWHEPPGPADAEPETWQGLMRSSVLRYYSYTRFATPVTISCAGYTDLIRLERRGDRLEAALGREPVLELSMQIDADGRFSAVVPVEGDTWVYGGVMIFDKQPVLHLWGQLDEVSGLGEGRLNVSPGDERLGCPGRFMISRNGGVPPAEEFGAPFRVKYWINEVHRDDRIFSHRYWPFGRIL